MRQLCISQPWQSDWPYIHRALNMTMPSIWWKMLFLFKLFLLYNSNKPRPQTERWAFSDVVTRQPWKKTAFTLRSQSDGVLQEINILKIHCSFCDLTAASVTSQQLPADHHCIWKLSQIYSSTTGTSNYLEFDYIKNINFMLIWLVLISEGYFFINNQQHGCFKCATSN